MNMQRRSIVSILSIVYLFNCSDPSPDPDPELDVIVDDCSDIITDTTYSKVLTGTAGYDIIKTADCGYVISGSTGKTILMKTDEFGNEIWSGTYGGISGSHWGNSVNQTTDGGYIIGAAQNTIIKTDSLP